MENLSFSDPLKAIWGIHVHQELAQTDFAKALVVQQACAAYLQSHGLWITEQGATRPGYGPHLGHMWELRLEQQPELALKALGLALSFMAVNRMDLNAYIHPLMHDPNKVNDLATEGLKNQRNILWFGDKVQQQPSFFIDPPLDDDGYIIDTRTPNLYLEREKQQLLALGQQQLANKTFVDPHSEILNGFHIHVDVLPEQMELALAVFNEMVAYFNRIGIPPTSTRIYEPGENGPHIRGGWEIKFERPDAIVLEDIGIAVGWLMCNRHNLPIFVHPVSWHEGDYSKEIYAHDKQRMFMEEMVPLDLNFFLPEALQG